MSEDVGEKLEMDFATWQALSNIGIVRTGPFLEFFVRKQFCDGGLTTLARQINALSWPSRRKSNHPGKQSDGNDINNTLATTTTTTDNNSTRDKIQRAMDS